MSFQDFAQLSLPGYVDKFLIINSQKSVEMQQPNIPSLLLNQTIRKTIDNNIQQALRTLHEYPHEGVPMLNNQILKQYVKQIYKTYQLKNPFTFEKQNLGIDHSNNNIWKNQNYFDLRTVRSRKTKARELKERFLSQLQSDSTLTVRKYDRDGHPMYCYQQLLQNLCNKNQKISPVFRYCILCENAILQKNIPFHQEKQCIGFSQLYLLTHSELKSLLSTKINNLRIKLLDNIQKLHSTQCAEIDPKVKQFLKSVDLQLKGQHNKHIKTNDIKKWGQIYMSIIENSQKIQWFVTIFKAISQSKNKISQSTYYEASHLSDTQSISLQQSTIRRKTTYSYNEQTKNQSQSQHQNNKITVFKTIIDQKIF